MSMTTPRPHAIGSPGYSETWPSEPRTARRSRELVKAALCAWGFDGEFVDQAVLVTSELVTNSILHSGCQLLRVTVARPRARLVQISVEDTSRSKPTNREAGPKDEQGRGLLLISALAANWDVELRHSGKTVFAEMVVPD
ncbi:ATP-binding protein [Streptomyces sp. DW4-2]|uniref:ATP-binding protein n=2 Tax=Streptomyces spirodelae TaxID=2812904 RepID=A0ABS3WS74_9ACTN|nr:ATP-binding protein [Streptomyces spirodelae]